MKVAIIGGGFAGLATAYFLLESKRAEVTIFESKAIGAGASGVASGLMHPYPGIKARRSLRAEEALSVACNLLRVSEMHTPKMVASSSGIFRQSLDKEQHERMLDHCDHFKDVEHLEENLFLIHTGITVMTENYLEGLALSIQKMGGEIRFEKVDSLSQLSSFDHIVVAAGFGIKQFPECNHLKVKFLKGQALRLEGKPPRGKSFISKGYVAHFGSETEFDIGSTYEREFQDEKPDIETASKLLQDKLLLSPDAKIIYCKAGVRVCWANHYLPTIEKIADNAHVFTGLGSRGLLYHGLYGRELANRIVNNALMA